MPTNRRLRVRTRREPPIDATTWSLLTDAPLPDDYNRFRALAFDHIAARLWKEHRAEVLARWIKDQPGTRPTCWWRFDAPEAEARQRVGGIGTPACFALAYAPRCERGMYADWLPDWAITFYKLCMPRFDFDRPPVFESEATYLQRHKLLQPDETKRLRRHHFQPETLPRHLWPHEGDYPT